MRLKRPYKKRDEENLIPLINIVFLMLILFLAAGVLRPFKEGSVSPAESSFSQQGERPMEPVLVDRSGRIFVGGEEHDPASLTSLLQSRRTAGMTNPVPVVADRDLPADQLVDVIEATKAAGVEKIRLVTRRRAMP
ncbi:MAG: biopolymer transporter ExbD [Hyphomicrobiales bacterium]|nr:MAG: biopolymer transporter ExbD [Hyphomicrobiales bacterium]